MISADLIKQLKSAGYEGEFDLESMIKECRDGFQDIKKIHKKAWFCNFRGYFSKYRSLIDNPECEEYDTLGKTPSEAVAKLLLKLLKK